MSTAEDTNDFYALALTILFSVSALIDLMGIAFNVLIIKVMRGSVFSQQPGSPIGFSLALTDMVGLTLYLIAKILLFLHGTNPLDLSSLMCKVGNWLYLVFYHLDLTLIALMCIERLVIVTRPLDASIIMTRSRVRTIIIVCTVSIFVWYFEIPFSRDLIEVTGTDTDSTYYTCAYLDFVMTNALTMFVFVKGIVNEVIFWLTILAIIIINIVIIIKMRRRQEAAKDLGVDMQQREKQTKRVTITALAISFALVILLLPVSVAFLICEITGTDCYSGRSVVSLVCYFLVTLSTSVSWSVNFVLYFLTGSLFREEAKKLFICCRNQE